MTKSRFAWPNSSRFTRVVFAASLARRLLADMGVRGWNELCAVTCEPSTFARPTLAALTLVACPLVGCEKAERGAGSPSVATSEAASPSLAQVADAEAQRAPAVAPGAPAPPEGMVLVSGGKFEMGMPPELTGGNPRVPMRVAPFFLDVLEVSTDAYLACVRAERCEPPAKKVGCNASGKKPRLKHPVNCVTKVQAERYCAQQGKRLPTEAEWEFAARGTDGRTYPWGNALPSDQLCWELRPGGDAATCAVGSYPQGASPFGALDMAGNVFEWTSSQEANGLVHEPEGQGAFRIRGGSFKVEDLSGPDDYAVRSDWVSRYPYDGASTEIGVRCAKSI